MSARVDEMVRVFADQLDASQAADRQRARVLPRTRATLRLPAPSVRTVALVSCGKAKGDAPARAGELYMSPLFRKSIELASLVAEKTFVVSAAKDRVVELDEIVAPYDVELRSMGTPARMAWGRSIVRSLVDQTFGTPTALRVVIFAGRTYATPIVHAIEEARTKSTRWAAPVDLLRDLEIGDRLYFLNRGIRIARGQL